MLYTELSDEVALLCGSPPSKDLLVSTANRALRDIYSQRRITRTVRLANRGLNRVSHYKKIECIVGHEYQLPINGVAISMKIHGSATYLIRNGTDFKVYNVDTGNEIQLVKLFVPQGGAMVFWTHYAFSIYDFSVYDRVFSPNVEDIPDGADTKIIDLRAQYGDFMSFLSPPTDAYGNILENYRLYDGKLEIDSDFDGEIIINYRRLPLSLTGVEDTETVDVPEEYAHLLPILIAHYLLLGTENEAKGKYFKSIYDDGMKLIGELHYDVIEPTYIDTNGWA